ncbi:unnamed protein product [Menidia menidia]|uniref:(Atlantic silverside) hypothetical protein n=1 Tax=Menidia menidia TaxID=238744 RepID=A0A8S4BYX4_9TELE|nr:unnamed protein product [Menidia menidia]
MRTRHEKRTLPSNTEEVLRFIHWGQAGGGRGRGGRGGGGRREGGREGRAALRGTRCLVERHGLCFPGLRRAARFSSSASPSSNSGLKLPSNGGGLPETRFNTPLPPPTTPPSSPLPGGQVMMARGAALRDARIPGGPRGPLGLPGWLLGLLGLLLATGPGPARAQELPSPGLNGYSLHPPYFNLAEGTKIAATATCGEDEAGRSVRDLYCKLVGGPVSGDPSQTIQGQYCDVCDLGHSDRAHPITNAIDGTERWWQSPPLSRSTEFNQVNVTLDLGQLFHVAYVLIKFANSPRPDLWVLERSTDSGRTYQPWQFFASSKRDCIERFGPRTIERISSDDDVICTTEYSRIVPLENGEVVVSLVNGRPGAMNFSYSPVLRDFTKATNIRLRFLRTNTLLGHLMGKALRDPTVTRRYYYSIKDISIGGRCVCNGHAEACNAQDPNDPYKLQCDCQHNTCGLSCDQCCPGYNQLPWKPATTYSANECEPCNCHRHSFECYYDPEVDRRRGSLDVQGRSRGGGVCLHCQHHTTGVNCERCIPTYYRSPDHPLDSQLACSPCNCQSEFTNGSCEDLTGRCFCKPNYSGEDCHSCASGFIHFPACYPIPTYPTNNNNGEAKPAGEIINCECSAPGTVDNSCRPDPQTRTCVCKPGFAGDHCDACAPGFHGPNCQACQCSGAGCQEGSCDPAGGQGSCRTGFQGYHCDSCAPGYFNYPLCQQCSCDPRTSRDSGCSESGLCHCRPNYSGPSCDQCAPGYYGYPSCTPCQCSAEGSGHSSCHQASGQCACLPGVGGPRCDSCAPGFYGFPSCKAGSCHPAGSVDHAVLPPGGQCECRQHVEGPACDRCKPLYWNLSPDTSAGCSSKTPPVSPPGYGPWAALTRSFWLFSPAGCECNTAGTLSGVAECAQETGQCPCKPGVCSGTCSTCRDGYHNLQDHSYFGCSGCQCDIGGAVGQVCGNRNGQCQCRPNVEGPKCNFPRPDHYFPDLHHLKFEIEEGTMLDGRPARFGYNQLEFPNFSWRGYAQMSPIQSKVLVAVWVTSPDLFRVVLRYASRGGAHVQGRVSVIEEARDHRCGNLKLQVYVSEADVYLTRFILRYVNSEGVTSNGKITAYQTSRTGSEQSKQIVFAPSAQPTFVNVPQNSFVEPFVLNPGAWTVVIEAEGILLDYLVLLPSAYYEAPILQIRVTEPCHYSPEVNQNCLLYTYLSLDSFPTISGHDASCRHDNHLPRQCQIEKVTPRHPEMAVCSGHDIIVALRGRLSAPGSYVAVIEYSSEEELPQVLSVAVNVPGARAHQHRVTLLHCKYSFLCRAVAIDDQNRVAVFSLPADPEIQLSSDRSSFFLHKVYLVPQEQFTMEYVEPEVHCINSHGQFSPDSSSCVPSRFQTPSDSVVLKEGQSSSTLEGTVQASPPEASSLTLLQEDQPGWMGGVKPPFGADNNDHMRLDSLQNAAVYSARVSSPGRYVFILHYHQPQHPTYPVTVDINAGRIWQGQTNASFCPHAYGCRNVLVSQDQIILDVTDHDLLLTVHIPAGKTLWLDYVLVVPEASYSSSYLNEEPLDKSYDFISNCGQNSFYINPSSAPPFCLASAVSLSAFFNNGALPCGCHEAGAQSDTCQQFGGQCQCRPNVIGRDCSMCATGFWGFPNCRPCNCGERLCEPTTGDCICPPRTVLPECTRCEPQTFGCHPLVGCEVCNCSRPGLLSLDVSCDTDSGQCSSSCVPSRFQTPSDSVVLKEGQSSSTLEGTVQASPPEASPLTLLQEDQPDWMGGVKPPFGADNNDHMRLDSLQNAAVYSARVSSPGRYVFILHYHQPQHPTYPVTVDINAGRIWQGHTNASFCPHAYGCRNVLVSQDQIILDVTDHDLLLTVHIPAGKTLWLDYVLVVPEASYSSSYLNEEPLDKSYDFISNCGQNSFYINPSSAPPFCLASAVSLSAFFNNGALPCGCHEAGAQSDTCQQFGGQCQCRPNVIGRDCSMCATGFWGFPNCRPCNCGERLCEPTTGDCICPPRTVLPECTRCQPQTFGCHPLVGCEVCNCSRPGLLSLDVSCDTDSGQCRCKNNIIGRQCDRCAPGFYGYPNCRPCDCNEAGTEEEVCDSFTGRCLCKENVQGSRCDQCRIGTFYLDPTNPKGCTSCFCFGATNRCHSSDKRRTEIMDMEGWVLLGADRQEVPVALYPGQDLVEADLSDVPDVYQDLHWHAPKAYLGDKVSSYGGYLRYRLQTQTMRGDALSLPAEASRPDIILKGNQMTLVFMEREYSSPEEPHLGIVHLVEGSFRHAQTGNSVSREELMMVLVSLESLQIRALHSQSAHSVSLRGAVLEGAQSLTTGLHANNVEICMCPANYLGDSCQKCAPGYYRDTIGLFLGKCVPCNCNGHSDQCLDGSGICVSCQHNTAGSHCERCRGGFFGNNSLDGQAVSCSGCPCPLRAPSNNFAEGCVERNDRMQCLCMQGYAGQNCERCAPGFYGNPMILGSRCQPCDCHGNTDPNMLFTDCHPLTGRCQGCMHNTAGERCQTCAPGYYGDAVLAKNCTECSCSPCGTESCDPHTGQCRCKEGVTGPRCDRCEDGSFGFGSCSGCRRCDCDASAALVQPCDPQSGQCACRPGVNGPGCRQCAPGFWDYGPDGCKRCDCRGGRCDPRTGECRCPDGMAGRQCDTCVHKHSVPVEDQHGLHCQPCDSCVIVLLEDLDRLGANFSAVAERLGGLNASAMAWTQLHKLNASIADISSAIEKYNSSLDDSRARADTLDAEIVTIDDDIDELEKKVEAMMDSVDGLEGSTTKTYQRAEDLLSFVDNMTADINSIVLMSNRSVNDSDGEQDVEDREKKTREVQAMLREMRFRSCARQKKVAERERAEAEKLLERVRQELAGGQEENEASARALAERLARFGLEASDLREALDEAENRTALTRALNAAGRDRLGDVQRTVEDLLLGQGEGEVNGLLAEAGEDLAKVNSVMATLYQYKQEYADSEAQLDGARSLLAKKVQNFTLTGSKMAVVEEAERHAELLNALATNLSR